MKRYDVVQVGFGPGGQALAALLGRKGHSVLALERYPALYNLPRAGHIDHEVVRTVQQVGDAQGLADKMWEVRGDFLWFNAEGVAIWRQPMDLGDAISGWYADYFLYQPVLEDTMTAAIADMRVVDTLFGWDVVGIEQGDEFAEVVCNRVSYENGERVRSEEYQRVQARYVVAADGASSFVRTMLGIPREDFGFDEHWLDVDMRTLDPSLTFEPNVAQFCDPSRPRLVMPLGPLHRRFEWMILPGEDRAHFARPETAWELLAEYGVTSETHEITRQLVYRFQSRIATGWRAGRVMIAGDAAHTMPPFAGQGVCSAIRDATNLAWKLDLILRSLVSDEILDSYEPERRPHAEAWTRISIHQGEISCTIDPERAAERDAMLLSGAAMPLPAFPDLGDGILDLDQAGGRTGLVGTLGIQARVRRGEVEGLFDDVLGHSRFQIVTMGGDPWSVLDPRQRGALETLDAIVVRVVGGDEEAQDAAAVVDVDGLYRDYFSSNEIVALINRPDFYVYGAVSDLDDLGGLVDRLVSGLGLRLQAVR